MCIGIIALANAIPNMGAISSVNLLNNNIGIDQAKNLVSILKEHPTLNTFCGIKGNETELDMSGKMDGAGDAIMLVAEIVGNGALSKLNLKDNKLATAEAGEALGEALKGNMVLKELDISGNALRHAYEGDTSCFGGADGPGFAKAISKGLSGNGALTSLHVGQNSIPEKEMREIMAITARMDSMKILCGVPFKDKTITELDVSGKNLGLEGALVATEYLDGNGAMTSLNLGSNNLGVEGAKIIAAILPKCM
jgi:hypothetical protein